MRIYREHCIAERLNSDQPCSVSCHQSGNFILLLVSLHDAKASAIKPRWL